MKLKASEKGFTLLELLITVAIVGILGALAYPAYTDQITRGRRAEAKVALNKLALWLERNRALTGSYQTGPDGNTIINGTLKELGLNNASNLGSTQYYDLGFAGAAGNATATSGTSYLIRATPQNGQEKSDVTCGALTLDHLGRKGIAPDLGSAGATPVYDNTAKNCWAK